MKCMSISCGVQYCPQLAKSFVIELPVNLWLYFIELLQYYGMDKSPICGVFYSRWTI
jgi:hypothetical protein